MYSLLIIPPRLKCRLNHLLYNLKKEVTTMKRLPPVHPGEVLLEDFLKPRGLTPDRVAQGIGVPAPRVHQIVKHERGISADTALRLARYFGTSAEVWMRMQARYEFEVAKTKLQRRINKEVKILVQ
jgi:addiction module HigA family antidote